MQATFIGRSAELAQIEEMLGAIEHGPAHVLAVSGEAGIGKTRLLFELGARTPRPDRGRDRARAAAPAGRRPADARGRGRRRGPVRARAGRRRRLDPGRARARVDRRARRARHGAHRRHAATIPLAPSDRAPGGVRRARPRPAARRPPPGGAGAARDPRAGGGDRPSPGAGGATGRRGGRRRARIGRCPSGVGCPGLGRAVAAAWACASGHSPRSRVCSTCRPRPSRAT